MATALIQTMYARNVEIVHGPDGLQFVFPPGSAAGGFGFATTAHRLEETGLPAKAHYSGQGLLGDATTVLVGVEALVIVQPDTVVGWHRTGFKLYWTWLSRHKTRAGRKRVSRELRELIFRMVGENPRWGAPRIHGELKMLGFDISERTVLRWMQEAPRNPEPGKQWKAFLNNHREAIAAMDFFTVPTLAFGVLYCFFVIAHDRRRILHFNVTKHPTSAWVAQQLREAFPYDSVPGYLIFDRGTNFNDDVVSIIKSFGITPRRTSFRSPWQNGVAERWVGNCRRDLLDHVIVLNERHLKRLMSEYVGYYHVDRTHLSLKKETPASRAAVENPGADGRVLSMPRLGGLHHRYDLAA